MACIGFQIEQLSCPFNGCAAAQAPDDEFSLPSLPCAANGYLSGEPLSQPHMLGASPGLLRFGEGCVL